MTEPKSVLFLVSTLIIGGSERKTVRIANELQRRGWNVHVAYLSSPESLLQDIDDGVSVFHLQRRGKFSLRSVKMLRQYIGSNQIDSIVCINLYPLIYAAIATMFIGKKSSPDIVLTVNTTDHVGFKERSQMLL